jgi:tRNA A-37 threonylcarbamoyl transferase component Bud32
MCIVWQRQLDSHIKQYADELAAQHGATASTSYRTQGAFNRCYEVKIQEKLTTIFRFPILGKVAFRKEKVIDEATVMKYVVKHTSIPVPRLIRVSDSSWGPCMVMEHIKGTLLSDALKAPREPDKLEVLDPNINPQTLTKAYQTMSRILIELSKCQFPRIGGLSRDPSGN